MASAPASAMGRKRFQLPARGGPRLLWPMSLAIRQSKLTAAAMRSDKRRKLMEAWATYCEPKASGNVVQIRRRKQSVPK